MPPLTRAAAGLAALCLALALGCGNRVIELDLPDAAGTTPPATGQCEYVKSDAGYVCTICILPDGTAVNRGCEPPASPGGNGGASGAAVAECKVIPRDDLRCLSCGSAAGIYSPCLACEAPVATSATGDSCRACAWSDAPDRRCLQCFTSGKPTSDDCNSLRSERLLGP
jgi:hypothetical protein